MSAPIVSTKFSLPIEIPPLLLSRCFPWTPFCEKYSLIRSSLAWQVWKFPTIKQRYTDAFVSTVGRQTIYQLLKMTHTRLAELVPKIRISQTSKREKETW